MQPLEQPAERAEVENAAGVAPCWRPRCQTSQGLRPPRCPIRDSRGRGLVSDLRAALLARFAGELAQG